MQCWNKTVAKTTASTGPFGVLNQNHCHMALHRPALVGNGRTEMKETCCYS